MKRVFAVAIGIAIVFSGVAAASVLPASQPSKTPSASSERQNEPKENESNKEVSDSDQEASNEAEDAGIHGGPIDRFHTGGQCDLTNVSGLPGNWTHGDYVSAVAAGGDPALIQQAAQSDCGKPMVAVGHGGGPPANALANIAAGQAHAGGS